MNSIDKQFYHLIRTLNTKNQNELFNEIKNNYLHLPKELKQSFEDYFKKFSYWGKLSEEENEFEHIELKAETLTNHLSDIHWLYQNLMDYRSKGLLLAIINNWYKYDFTTLGTFLEHNFHAYFDLDLIPNAKEEVFVDLGAYTGDTILDYLNLYGETSYKKIYGYEITEETFSTLQKNVAFYPNIILRKKAVIDETKTVYFEESNVDASANTIQESGTRMVEGVTLDQDIKEKITMLKMDIEGSEQQALIGATKHIKEDHPKLFLSVYHSFEDLWKIPRMIKEIEPDYQFYLRSHGGSIFPTEVTLIGIYQPKNDYSR